MDYDALKDQWSDVEDRDGIRLSWNVFPSSRMVIILHEISLSLDLQLVGSFSTCSANRSSIYATERETRVSCSSVRASGL